MSHDTIGELCSSSVMSRSERNPVLSRHDVPYNDALVFNAGVAKYEGRYVMVFRNDYGSWEDQELSGRTNLGLAFSDDGVEWEAEPEPRWEVHTEEINRVYDPRLIVMEGWCYVCFAMSTRHGVRGGIARTRDFEDFEILSLSVPENRNMVLFPERFQGKYVRLERPFPMYSRGGRERFDTWVSDSPDLRYWGNSRLHLTVEDVPFANTKVGPAAPPVKTDAGWLTTFHAVDTDPDRGKNGWGASWPKRYTAGLMLLDREDPAEIIGLYEEPLLAPEAEYEISGGFRNNVIFPGRMIEEEEGKVKKD